MEFSKTLFILLSITFSISSISASRQLVQSTNTEFIKTSCSATRYPKLCYNSLSIHASAIQTSPKLIASTALSVTLSTAKSTSTTMVKLAQGHGMKPREVAAMHDCVEELSDSVDELEKSLREMCSFKGGQDFELMISDIQTWVSAALTEESTCTDGFGGNFMNGNLKNVVKGKIVNIAQLTSNALALINRYASLHG